MFGRGEKAGNGEGLLRRRAKQVGENVKNAVNDGEREEVEIQYAASWDGWQNDPAMLANTAAAEKILSWFPDDEKLREKIVDKLADEADKWKWNSYMGPALEAKEKEVGSMLTDEEREEQKLVAAERREIEKKVAEKRAEVERRVEKKVRGKKGFIRARMRLALGLAAMGASMFLSACGVSTEREVHDAHELMLGGDKDRDDDKEIITPEMAGEAPMVMEAERPAGVRPGVNDETIGEETMRSLDEILELSKSCNLMEFSPEELELAGNDPELLAWFEASEESRVLENGLQLNYGGKGYYSENKTAGKNSYGESLEDTDGDRETAMDGMMGAYFAQPQELATIVAKCPSILRAAGVDEDVIAIDDLLEQSRAIYQQMLTREDGGALQARLRGALKLVLMNEQTSYNFYIENGVEDTFYLKPIDPSTKESPETNLEIELEYNRKRDGAKQLQVVFGDESFDINLKCTQRNRNKDTPVKEETRKTTTQERKQEETTTKEENNQEEGNQEEGNQEEGNQEEGNQEEGNQEEGNQEEGNQEEGNQEEGNQEEGNQEEGNQEEGNQEEGNQEEGNQEETIKGKSETGQKEVVNNGTQTNPVALTGNVDDLAGSGIQAPSNGTAENQIPKNEIKGNTTGTYDVTGNPVIGGENGDGKIVSTGGEGTGEGTEGDGTEGGEGTGEGSEGGNGESGTDYNMAVVEGTVNDENVSDEENLELNKKQEDAEAGEITTDMTPEQFAEYLRQFMDSLSGGAGN